MFRMINPVREYAWGSTTAFSRHFGWPAAQTPQAEIWMGAHPAAPSQLLVPTPDGATTRQPLDDPDFPYLLKVLAADRPLSIQVHPTKEQAVLGYEAEDRQGIPLEAAERNYVDRNHKPELVVGLTDFTALCGFRPHRDAAADLQLLHESLTARGADGSILSGLEVLLDHVRSEDYSAALEHVLRSGREAGAAVAQAVNALLSRRARRASPPGDDASASAQHVTADLPSKLVDTLTRVTRAFPDDPGILVTVLLNRVDLSPGEALYLPSGNLHAYLHGVGIEVMANSDNVLRGGLTDKHIDAAQLLAAAQSEVLPVPHCPAEHSGPGRYSYRPAFDEFQLKRIDFPSAGDAVPLHPQGPAVLLCTEGTLEVTVRPAGSQDADTAARQPLVLAAGESVFLGFADAPAASHPAASRSVSYAVSAVEGVDQAQAFMALPGTG